MGDNIDGDLDEDLLNNFGINFVNDNSDTEGQNTPEQERKRKAEQLEWMECPVCLETPRSGPIYSCRKGHIICKEREQSRYGYEIFHQYEKLT